MWIQDKQVSYIRGTMTSIWLARDKDGNLWGYLDKPIRGEKFFHGESTGFSIIGNLFPEITWENSPVEFTGVINNE